MRNYKHITRGTMCIGGISEPKFALLGGRSLEFSGSMTLIVFIVLIGGLLLVALLQRGQISLNLRAIREDKLAAEPFGVHATPYVAIAVILSITLAGLAGMMFAYQQCYVSADAFSLI